MLAPRTFDLPIQSSVDAGKCQTMDQSVQDNRLFSKEFIDMLTKIEREILTTDDIQWIADHEPLL